MILIQSAWDAKWELTKTLLYVNQICILFFFLIIPFGMAQVINVGFLIKKQFILLILFHLSYILIFIFCGLKSFDRTFSGY